MDTEVLGVLSDTCQVGALELQPRKASIKEAGHGHLFIHISATFWAGETLVFLEDIQRSEII